jgi:hypothetical protein
MSDDEYRNALVTLLRSVREWDVGRGEISESKETLGNEAADFIEQQLKRIAELEARVKSEVAANMLLQQNALFNKNATMTLCANHEKRIAELEAESQRRLNIISELVEVADMRGDADLPHPADDPKMWTARMSDAWDEARNEISKAEEALAQKPVSADHAAPLKFTDEITEPTSEEMDALIKQVAERTCGTCNKSGPNGVECTRYFQDCGAIHDYAFHQPKEGAA